MLHAYAAWWPNSINGGARSLVRPRLRPRFRGRSQFVRCCRCRRIPLTGKRATMGRLHVVRTDDEDILHPLART